MTSEETKETDEKEFELIVKKGNQDRINFDLGDYRAFLSFALLGVTAYFAHVENEVWREFALMTGMALAWWFKRDSK